jgi:hypothetical protein
MNVLVNLNSGALGVTNKSATNNAQNLINRYELARTALVMMFCNWNLCILDGESPKHFPHPSYDVQQERNPGRGKSVSAKMNFKLVTKPLLDRSSQDWNQFRITEPSSVADSDRKVVTSESRDRGLSKIGYQRCVLWRKEQATGVQKSQEHPWVVPFQCAILLEESHRRGGGILSWILRRRESKRRTMSEDVKEIKDCWDASLWRNIRKLKQISLIQIPKAWI